MVKQHTDKHLINLGHNNPPVNPKSIDFTKEKWSLGLVILNKLQVPKKDTTTRNIIKRITHL